MFINPEIAETRGISDIGSSYASLESVFFFDVSIIDSDSFFDGVRGMDGVMDTSIKISDSSTLDFLEICFFISDFFILSIRSWRVRIFSKTHLSSLRSW